MTYIKYLIVFLSYLTIIVSISRLLISQRQLRSVIPKDILLKCNLTQWSIVNLSSHWRSLFRVLVISVFIGALGTAYFAVYNTLLSSYHFVFLILLASGSFSLSEMPWPCTILFLGPTSDSSYITQRFLNTALRPFSVISLLSTSRLFWRGYVGMHSFRVSDCDWRIAIHTLMHNLPLIILDAREDTNQCEYEFYKIHEFGLEYKTICIGTWTLQADWIANGGGIVSEDHDGVKKVVTQILNGRALPTPETPLAKWDSGSV